MPISKIPVGAIQSGTIGTSQIADNAVTTAKILDDNVTSAKIPNDAVGSTEIASSAITRDELQSAAVNNISSDSIILNSTNGTADAGDFLVLDGTDGSGSNANHRILFDETFVDKVGLFNINTLGSAGQALKVDTAGTGFEFGDTTSGLNLLNTTTVSGETFCAFDNTYINSTYDDYIIKASRVVPTTDGAYIRMFTSDQNGGNMTQGWYSDGIYQRMDNGSIARAGYLANQTYWDIIGGAAIGTASGETATYTVYLNNVNNSSQGGTTAQTHWVAHNSNNYYYHGTHSAYLDQGVATNYIRLYFSSGNIASGTFRLYGLAK